MSLPLLKGLTRAAPPPSPLIDSLRLARTPRIGPITYRQLIARFGTPGQALDALPELARRGGAKGAPTPPPRAVLEDEIAAIQKLGGRFVALGDPAYPEALAALEDAPPVFALLGHDTLLKKRAIAIVGARNASLSGRKMAERLAADLGREGFCVVSGLARGIDAAAHSAALATGTLGVLAGGVDVVYPEENRALYDKMVEAGALISEMPLGAEPKAHLFPRRNRLISGLSLGTIVVEAALRSGSLITAHFALDQGREVFAVPGSPLDPRAKGPNDLLRQGAVLVEGVGDILRHLAATPQSLAEPSRANENELATPIPLVNEADWAAFRAKVLENLSPTPVLVDELARRCQLSLPPLLAVLLELELAGRVERQPGQRVALILSFEQE